VAANRRELYVTPTIADLLNGGTPSLGFPHVGADQLVARYIAGFLVTVAVPYKPKCLADLERLDDVDEVWALCFRRPRPGWRLLGRFLWREKFIGLRLYDRHELPGKVYGESAEAVTKDWEAMFENEEPLRGSVASDYLDPVIVDVNEKE
jgi:hypothetical protein